MKRLLIGIVIGWLTARRYYSANPVGSGETTEPHERSMSERVHAIAGETRNVVRELAEEAKAAARIEGNNLDDKVQRIKNAAKD